MACPIDGCNKVSRSTEGLCEMHYYRLRRNGSPLVVRKESHGMSKTPEYAVWCGIKGRCYDKNHEAYKHYGGRGITVCDEWKYSFLTFLKDTGKRPFPKAEIDRIDNEGNYEPGNWKWGTRAENNRNTRANVLNWFTVRSIRRLYKLHKYKVKELCLIYNIKFGTMQGVIYNGSWKEPTKIKQMALKV